MRKIKKNSTLITTVLMLTAIAYIAGYWIFNAPKRALRKQIISMQDMHVNLDFDKALCIFNGKDSTFASAPTKKLIIFVDSTSCSSCFIGRLTDYFEFNDSLAKIQAPMLVILHPIQARLHDIISQLYRERFPFWCIVDSLGTFIDRNPDISNNRLLHTFTVNDDDDILLVGDPTQNQKIQNLFFQVITQ